MPYEAAWVTTLMGYPAGKVLIKVGDALYYFRGMVSGVLRYDKNTEEVYVGNDPYMSNAASSTNWGRIAKVISRVLNRYNPETEECYQEVVQEVASQNLGQRVDGQLLIGNVPDCGDLPLDQQANADQQMRLDYAAVPVAAGGEEGTGMLVAIPGTRNSNGKDVVVTLWKRLTALIFPKSMAGETVVGSAEYNTSAVLVVAVPTSGGTSLDPAYRLKFLDKMPPMLPLTATEGDILKYSSGQWIASNNAGLGGSLKMLDTPAQIITGHTGSGSVVVAMPNFPVTTGPVLALLSVTLDTPNSGGSIIMLVNGVRGCTIASGSATTTATFDITRTVTASTTFQFTETGGTGDDSTVVVMGYFY